VKALTDMSELVSCGGLLTLQDGLGDRWLSTWPEYISSIWRHTSTTCTQYFTQYRSGCYCLQYRMLQ